MLSHDWPGKVYNHGDLERLLRFKKHFRDDVEQGRLGSTPTRDVLDTLKPSYWFSAHLHVKLAALVPHQVMSSSLFTFSGTSEIIMTIL